jgi:predicted PurR-regulated permease PerM
MELTKIQLTFFTTLFITVGLLTLLIFWPFFNVLVLSAVFAVLMHPVYKRLLWFFKGYEHVAATVTLLLTCFIIIGPLVVIGMQIFNESRDLYSQMRGSSQEYIVKVTELLEDPAQQFFPGTSLDIVDYAKQASGFIFDNLGKIFSSTAHLFAHIILWLISFYFFIKDGEKFKDWLVALSPLDNSHDHEIMERLKSTIHSVVLGTIMVGIAQGSLVGIGFFVLGIPNPTLWGALAAVSAMIPGVGTWIVTAPAIIYLYFNGQLIFAIALIVWSIAIVGLIDNIIISIFYGRGAKLHPLFTLFAVLGGLLMFGPIGFIVGPVVLGLLLVLIDIYKMLVQDAKEVKVQKVKKA